MIRSVRNSQARQGRLGAVCCDGSSTSRSGQVGVAFERDRWTCRDGEQHHLGVIETMPEPKSCPDVRGGAVQGTFALATPSPAASFGRFATCRSTIDTVTCLCVPEVMRLQ